MNYWLANLIIDAGMAIIIIRDYSL